MTRRPMMYAGDKLSRLRRKLLAELTSEEPDRRAIVYLSNALACRTPAKYGWQRPFFEVLERWAREDFDLEGRLARIGPQIEAAKRRLDEVTAEIARKRAIFVETGDETAQWEAFTLTTGPEIEARQDFQHWQEVLNGHRRVF